MELTSQLQQFIEHKKEKLLVGGCQLGQKIFLSACLKEFFVYVVSNSDKIDEIYEQLKTLSRNPLIVKYVDNPLTYTLFDNSQDYEILSALKTENYDCLIIDVRCLSKKYPNKEKWSRNYIKFKVGENIDRENLHFNCLGYQRVSKVEKKGQYAIRGDIIDVYGTNQSVRISFFDTEIESIKKMNFEDNVVLEQLEEVEIAPNTFVFEEDIGKLQDVVNSLSTSGNVEAQASFENLKMQLQDNIKSLSHINSLSFVNFALNNAYIFDYIDNYTVVIDDTNVVKQSLENYYDSLNKQINELIDGGQLYTNYSENFHSYKDVSEFLDKSQSIVFDNFGSKMDLEFDTTATQNYKNKPELLINDIKELLKKEYAVNIFTTSEIDKSFLGDILQNKLINFEIQNEIDKSFEKGLKIINKTLPLGCILNGERIALIPYGNFKLNKNTQNRVDAPFFELPQEGDYVVHNFHGIGLCLGIQKLKISSFVRDYIVIKYDGSDKLYLPVENADSITKYIGQENPKLNKIGGAEFERAKKRVKEQLAVMAVDMLKIYAEREKLKGFKYEVNTFVQQQFDESFMYEETNDQLKAIEDIKHDMSSNKIMDRLICGDVGYGKTEVAFRACMIAIDNGKQVVFLAPTTVLSEQHYKSALSRFKDFGVKIAVLNRFKTAREQKEILQKVESGEIDLLIGTQKVLSPKIKFKDLGLLICDEEQKLGVNDKEKIKKLKHNIDVLSMSATPIPRTLHMSLVGIRDISTINTAPKLRKSVQTTICEYNDNLIKTVIQREIDRNGQVLIIRNRIEGIEKFTYKIQEFFPNLNIQFAHGQMDKTQLENTMKGMFDCKIDVLVATTLIENGVDLPNANTMIIIDADKFGLSSLYQLRGRVGRSNQQAYAYFTFSDFRSLTQESAKRLQAIQEYTDLGSGFKISMRDLELRGAGTVLGEKQSGHLEKVGYDMYCKLLEEVISTLKGQEDKQEVEIRVDIDIQAEIPNYYISDDKIKMEVIDRISKISNKDQLKIETDKLINEFGSLPLCTKNLMKIATLKNIYKNMGAKSIIFKCNGKNQIEFNRKPELTKSIETMGKISQIGEIYIFELPKNNDIIKQIDELINNS